MAEHRNDGTRALDVTVDGATVHAEAESIAVPIFDWISEPIAAVVDGLAGHADDDTALSPPIPCASTNRRRGPADSIRARATRA